MAEPDRVCIIAEAGVNHNGSRDAALRLVDAAADAGADVVKFQTFRADRIATRSVGKALYQSETTGAAETQHAMLQQLELDAPAHEALIERCRVRHIEFLSTPFDMESVDLLANRLRVRRLKVSSGDLTNGPLLLHMARAGRPVILSTGMGTLAEIEAALGVLAFGFTAPADAAPSMHAFEDAYRDPQGQATLQERVTLLHCTSEYPTPDEAVNLRVMDTLRAAFGLPVGYSDHTLGIHVAVAAAARGATVIEKHFTLDRALPGPDHRASLMPAELAEMVSAIRAVAKALGRPLKAPTAGEAETRRVARKSVVAARPIRRGEILSAAHLDVKRAGHGASAMRYWDLLGRPADRDYAVDEPIAL